MQKRGVLQKGFLLTLVLLLLATVVFSYTNQQSTGSVVRRGLLLSSPQPTQPQPVQPFPSAYCTPAQLLVPSISNPKISGKNIVMNTVPSRQSDIQVYDFQQQKVIPLYTGQAGIFDMSVDFEGRYILIERLATSNPKNTDFLIYDIGADLTAGTADDVGPVKIYSLPYSVWQFRPIYAVLRNNVFTVIDESLPNYPIIWCSVAIPSGPGSCMNGQVNTFQPQSANSKTTVFAWGNPATPFFIWSDYGSGAGRDIVSWYRDQSGIHEKRLLHLLQGGAVTDIRNPSKLFVYQELLSRGRNQIKSGIADAPGFSRDLVPAGNYEDNNGLLSPTRGVNGEQFVAWERTYDPYGTPHIEINVVTLSGTIINVPSSSRGTLPSIYGNKVVFDGGPQGSGVYVSNCYS